MSPDAINSWNNETPWFNQSEDKNLCASYIKTTNINIQHCATLCMTQGILWQYILVYQTYFKNLTICLSLYFVYSSAPDDHDTVGAVAIDAKGQIACATSTGGITAQMQGRVGDTPLIGKLK